MPRYKRKSRLSRKTKRAVLDVTTVKKRDNMLSYTNEAGATGTNYNLSPALLTTAGDASTNVNPWTFLWMPTARDLTTGSGALNNRTDETARTSTYPYMVGLKESIEIQTSDGLPWQWRRICFAAKLGNFIATTATFTAFYESTNDGYRRVVNRLAGDRSGGQTYTLYEILFAGQNQSDWFDPMVAKTDRNRLDIMYDKTITIAAGNEQGMIRKYTRYHPMGKTLVYADDENGTFPQNSFFSVTSKQGMGDYYVVDIIRPRYNPGVGHNLVFNPQATLYWHEK